VKKLVWLDPTPEMLSGDDERFDLVWSLIKTWDINVPEAYNGYCGATGNHVRAILDALDGKPQEFEDAPEPSNVVLRNPFAAIRADERGIELLRGLDI
jgi:hypothetical protein